jgi:hypothetical protein
MESATESGVHHYGYVTDAIDQVASDFKQKGATILRENRDDSGRLTTIFVKDPNGLELEIRSPASTQLQLSTPIVLDSQLGYHIVKASLTKRLSRGSSFLTRPLFDCSDSAPERLFVRSGENA